VLRATYGKKLIAPLVCAARARTDLWTVLKQLPRTPYLFFLDSGSPLDERVATNGLSRIHNRYSYLGWNPFLIYQVRRVENFIPRLRALFQKYQTARWRQLPFFTGGAVGYFSYEVARVFERLPEKARDDVGLDPVTLLFVRDLIVLDHRRNVFYLVANLIPKTDGSFERALGRAWRVIGQMQALLARADCQSRRTVVSLGALRVRNFRTDVSKRLFKQMVRRAKEYIEAGDIYQANLSQRFSFELEGGPEALYESLRRINPSPFASFLKMGPLVVASASPERLIKLRGNRCQIRPIAGTRPRGSTRLEESRLRRDLVASPKERAEHVMLVDLERNDLGRVAQVGSVRVSEFMTLERYSHVVHMVSNIVGKLRSGCDRFDLLQAVFPGGTITGCPKIRSMEIIEELEPFKRHLYTGSIGYLDFNGDMDLNIVIRSIIFYRNRGYLQLGAGIVYDSDPEAEYWETLHKGKALIDALCEHA